MNALIHIGVASRHGTPKCDFTHNESKAKVIVAGTEMQLWIEMDIMKLYYNYKLHEVVSYFKIL